VGGTVAAPAETNQGICGVPVMCFTGLCSLLLEAAGKRLLLQDHAHTRITGQLLGQPNPSRAFPDRAAI
jgi:hypothetical protein